ncbi:hypothetical protein TNIN_128331 [Trichonephila inaurata madagascariensis]|uniref:Uncharacterized protein n=1 Tax=Trichonephila inaurata madagascariensis TaxID=2747483 RepID=A0A8X6XE08_9ARAC|nr:hypothetical protein TNIN_128331 [Trichonephila inaurata madagascariensis]
MANEGKKAKEHTFWEQWTRKRGVGDSKFVPGEDKRGVRVGGTLGKTSDDRSSPLAIDDSSTRARWIQCLENKEGMAENGVPPGRRYQEDD